MSEQPRFLPCPMNYTTGPCGGILTLFYRGTGYTYKCQKCDAHWRQNGDPINAPRLGK